VTAIAMHSTPRWSDVAIEQIRAAGLRLRAIGVILLGTLLMFGGIAIRVALNFRNSIAAHPHQSPTSFGYSPEVSVLVMYLALILPAALWHEESPSRRMYHMSMPIDRSTHALTKALAGWAWAMIATLVFVLFIMAIDAITRRIAGISTPAFQGIEFWEWLVPFTSVTIAYMLSSAAAIGAETPAVWIVGPPVLYAGVAIVLAMLGLPQVSASMLKLFSGYYGAASSLGGQVLGMDSLGHATGPSIGRWLGATAIWGAGAAAILYLVSNRRRDVK
jgi:hypothetical protein